MSLHSWCKSGATGLGRQAMNPNQYTMAIPGYGTLGHLEGPRLFGLSHGLQVTYVPFQGLAPALTSTVGAT